MSYAVELGKLIEMNLRMRMESLGFSKMDINRVFGEGGSTLNVMGTTFNQPLGPTTVSSLPQFNPPKKAYFISPYTPKSCAIVGISYLPDNVASALKTRATNTNTRGVMYNPRLKIGCNGYVFSANNVAEHNSIFEDHVTQISYDEYVKLHEISSNVNDDTSKGSDECDDVDEECEEYSPEDAEKVFAALNQTHTTAKKPKSHPGAEAVVDTETSDGAEFSVGVATESEDCDDGDVDGVNRGKEEESDKEDVPSEDEKDSSSSPASSESEDGESDDGTSEPSDDDDSDNDDELYIIAPKNPTKLAMNKANKWGNSTDKEHGIIFKPLDVGKDGESIKVAVGVQDEKAPKSDRGCASILPLEEDEEEICKQNNWVYLTDEVIAVVESRNPEAAKKLSSILYDD